MGRLSPRLRGGRGRHSDLRGRSRDPKKQSTAISLIESLTDAVLLWQVACEYMSAGKKLEAFGYRRDQAWQDIQKLRLLWNAVLPGWEVADRARGSWIGTVYPIGTP